MEALVALPFAVAHLKIFGHRPQALNAVFNPVKKAVAENNEHCGLCCKQEAAQTNKTPYSCHAPHGGCRIQPAHAKPVTQDYTTCQKANACCYLCQDPGGAVAPYVLPRHYKECCPKGHQRIGMGACGVAAPAPLEPDNAPENQGQKQAQQYGGVFHGLKLLTKFKVVASAPVITKMSSGA
jgi:hypothetical protein